MNSSEVLNDINCMQCTHDKQSIDSPHNWIQLLETNLRWNAIDSHVVVIVRCVDTNHNILNEYYLINTTNDY